MSDQNEIDDKIQSAILAGRIERLCHESKVSPPGQASACLSVFTSILAGTGMPTDAILDLVVTSLEAARGYIDRDRARG